MFSICYWALAMLVASKTLVKQPNIVRQTFKIVCKRKYLPFGQVPKRCSSNTFCFRQLRKTFQTHCATDCAYQCCQVMFCDVAKRSNICWQLNCMFLKRLIVWAGFFITIPSNSSWLNYPEDTYLRRFLSDSTATKVLSSEFSLRQDLSQARPWRQV